MASEQSYVQKHGHRHPKLVTFEDGEGWEMSPISPNTKSPMYESDASIKEIELPELRVSTASLALTLSGLWLGILLTAMDMTMFATILTQVCATFNALPQLSWITTAITMGSIIATPMSRRLVQSVGSRAAFALSYSLFVIGVLLCGISPYTKSLAPLIIGRFVQGLGAGPLSAITAFIESDLVPVEKRGFIEKIGTLLFGIFLAFGGVYGGVISDRIGWKWVFLIQAPIMAVNAILLLLFAPIRDRRLGSGQSRIRGDYVGLILLIATLIFFQFGLTQGSTDEWYGTLVVGILMLCVLFFFFTLYWDVYEASSPIVPFKLFTDRAVFSTYVSTFSNHAATGAVTYFIPIYLRILGHNYLQCGLRLVPYGIALVVGNVVARTTIKALERYYHINILLHVVCVVASACLCTINENTHGYVIFICLALVGGGYGGAFVTYLMGILSSAEPSKQATAQNASSTIQSLGFQLGIVSAAAIFQSLSIDRLGTTFQHQPDVLSEIQHNLGFVSTLASQEREEALKIYMRAIRGVFYFTAGLSGLATISSIGMKNRQLPREMRKQATPSC